MADKMTSKQGKAYGWNTYTNLGCAKLLSIHDVCIQCSAINDVTGLGVTQHVIGTQKLSDLISHISVNTFWLCNGWTIYSDHLENIFLK